MTIIITSAQVLETPLDHVKLCFSQPDQLTPYTDSGASPPDPRYGPAAVMQEELVKSVRFIRPDGSSIFVGASKQVQEVLGIYYDTYHKMNDVLEENRTTIRKLQRKLRRETDLSVGELFKKLWKKYIWG